MHVYLLSVYVHSFEVPANLSSEIPPVVNKTNKMHFFVVQLLGRVPALHDPTDCSVPRSPVLDWLWVFSDSCLLSQWYHATISSSFAPFSFFFQFFPAIRVFFQWVSSLHHVAKVLELQLQHQSFQWIFRVDLLKGWLVWYPCLSKGLSRVFSSTTVWKYQFFGLQP